MDLIILLIYIVATFLVMFIIDAIWEKLQCRACNKISLRAFKHSYCDFCNVEIESDWDAIRKLEGDWTR